MVNEEIRDLLNELATCQANIDNGLFRTRGHWLDERNRIAAELADAWGRETADVAE